MQVRRLAIISNQAFSLVNFRGYLIRELVAAGVEVYALAPDYDDRFRGEVRSLGAVPVDFSLARTGMNPLRDGLDLLRLTNLLRRIRPDATLGYFIKPVIYGTIAAWLAGVPRRYALIEGLGYVFTESGAKESWRRVVLCWIVSALYRAALKRAERVFFLNDDDISEFVEKGIVDQDKTVKLGGIGVDLDEWRPLPPSMQPLTFLLAARLLREKGIVEYAEAARRVKRRYPNIRFVLLGGLDPNPGGLTQSEVEEWVREGLLEWPGHVDVRPWLAQTSVYVLPSYREGVPRSTQEAMAMGRPVITTDAPGCRETVEHGRNGFLVPVRDPRALAEAMLRFIEQPELIESMGRESRRMAEERFDVYKVNAVMLQAMGIERPRNLPFLLSVVPEKSEIPVAQEARKEAEVELGSS
ncbi:MAG: glycosyltransferase family 4 protein [Xanthomonadaceae bacterium]|nr:glycosyltransferase family 4 protein [Xanthomonadaceae bacterium]